LLASARATPNSIGFKIGPCNFSGGVNFSKRSLRAGFTEAYQREIASSIA
jgi:hypothetical protein